MSEGDKMEVTEAPEPESAPVVDESHEEAVAKMAEMGYNKEQADKALRETKSVEAALEWLMNNGDAMDAAQAKSAKSIRCVETGKLFRTMADAMIYAERTGHANFEETEVEIPPLTAEEKAERLKKVKEMIKTKVAQREENEKKEGREREKARIAGGKEMGKIREEQQLLQRKREAEARDREKQRYAAEAKRLHEQVARDKAERAMEKAERLGLGNPKEAYDKAYAAAIGASNPEEKSPVERADACLKVIDAFRVGGKGFECVKTLKKMLQNVHANPTELKFRKVNLVNETFKAKVGSVQGGTAILKAAGFDVSPDDENTLILATDADLQRLEQVLDRVKTQEAKMSPES
jgi:hypothetical protein